MGYGSVAAPRLGLGEGQSPATTPCAVWGPTPRIRTLRRRRTSCGTDSPAPREGRTAPESAPGIRAPARGSQDHVLATFGTGRGVIHKPHDVVCCFHGRYTRGNDVLHRPDQPQQFRAVDQADRLAASEVAGLGGEGPGGHDDRFGSTLGGQDSELLPDNLDPDRLLSPLFALHQGLRPVPGQNQVDAAIRTTPRASASTTGPWPTLTVGSTNLRIRNATAPTMRLTHQGARSRSSRGLWFRRFMFGAVCVPRPVQAATAVRRMASRVRTNSSSCHESTTPWTSSRRPPLRCHLI